MKSSERSETPAAAGHTIYGRGGEQVRLESSSSGRREIIKGLGCVAKKLDFIQ